jgi:phospholipase C
MRLVWISAAALLLPGVLNMCLPTRAVANGDIHKVKHVIIVMQENHSFDNYFGALAYAPGSPYHTTSGGCRQEDHNCVDGLSCKVDAAGNLTCFSSNLDDNGTTVFAFHDSRRCVAPDLDHSWLGTHKEANFLNPNGTLGETLSDGFVRVNDATEQLDKGVENAKDDQTMGFYNQDEIPFYYNLAANFAVSDRYFSPMLGPTFTNRAYFMAATSFDT